MRPVHAVLAASISLGVVAGLAIAASTARADPAVDLCVSLGEELDQAIRAHVDLRVRLDDLLDTDGLLDDLGVTEHDKADAARREAEAAVRVRVLTDQRDRACTRATVIPVPTTTSRAPTQVPAPATSGQVRATPRAHPETGGGPVHGG